MSLAWQGPNMRAALEEAHHVSAPTCWIIGATTVRKRRGARKGTG